MKIIITLITFCLAITAQAFTVTATTETATVEAVTVPATTITLPEELPIGSKAMLTAYALSRAKMVSAQLWSESILSFDGEVSYLFFWGEGADDLIQKVNSPTSTFNVRVYDPVKPLYLYGYIGDENGDALFDSYSNVVQTETVGTNALILKNAKLEFRLSWIIPIPIEGVTGGYIKHEGEDGKEWYEEVWVSNGKVHFPVSYAGTGGTLILFSSNSSSAYNISTGKKIIPTTVAGGVSTSIQNHFYATDAGSSPASQLVVSGRLTPPATNNWEVVTPPTATFKVTVPQGNKRTCKMTVVVSKTLTSLGTISAWAYDPARVDQSGSVTEISGYVSTSTSGGDTVITVTWTLDNDTGADASNWNCYLEIGAYEAQSPPTEPYYYGGKG
jgi:hypothetical protein